LNRKACAAGSKVHTEIIRQAALYRFAAADLAASEAHWLARRSGAVQ
jgi:hypothetical protein